MTPDRERVKDELAAHPKGIDTHFESESVLNKDGTFGGLRGNCCS